MKLAEALQERADLNRSIEELKNRLSRNALVQEGEAPAEDPEKLRRELDASLARLAYLSNISPFMSYSHEMTFDISSERASLWLAERNSSLVRRSSVMSLKNTSCM